MTRVYRSYMCPHSNCNRKFYSIEDMEAHQDESHHHQCHSCYSEFHAKFFLDEHQCPAGGGGASYGYSSLVDRDVMSRTHSRMTAIDDDGEIIQRDPLASLPLSRPRAAHWMTSRHLPGPRHGLGYAAIRRFVDPGEHESISNHTAQRPSYANATKGTGGGSAAASSAAASNNSSANRQGQGQGQNQGQSAASPNQGQGQGQSQNKSPQPQSSQQQSTQQSSAPRQGAPAAAIVQSQAPAAGSSNRSSPATQQSVANRGTTQTQTQTATSSTVNNSNQNQEIGFRSAAAGGDPNFPSNYDDSDDYSNFDSSLLAEDSIDDEFLARLIDTNTNTRPPELRIQVENMESSRGMNRGVPAAVSTKPGAQPATGVQPDAAPSSRSSGTVSS